MNDQPDMLDVTLMGRDYRVACEPGERDQLQSAVAFLDNRLCQLAEKTRATGERLAVTAALNIAHELLQLKAASSFDIEAAKRRIIAMGSRIDEALAQQEQLF